MLVDAFEFYYKAAKLKEMLREGPIQWGAKTERKEGIAEHIYGALVLAIGLKGELNLNLDLGKVLEILTIHEFEEIGIGDITPLDNVDKGEFKADARKAVEEVISPLGKKTRSEIMALTEEFNSRSSLEARFARAVDKLECVLEFKKYQDRGEAALSHLTKNMLENKKLAAMIKENKYDLADIFFFYDEEAYSEFGIDGKFWYEKLKLLKI